MPYPIREFVPDRWYFLTNRTLDSMFLFKPDSEVGRIVAERFIAAAERYGIEVYGFICMSNHWHSVCRAPSGNMEKFLRDFQGAVATDLNRKWGRTGGGFFARRASAEPILDENELLEKVLYILANPAASDLVATVREWPGLSSAPELLFNKKRTFRIFRRRAWHLAGRPKNNKKFIREVEFKHAVLPTLAKLSPEERAAKLSELLAAKEKKHADRRATEGKTVLGRKRILAANWYDRPLDTDKSPRPLCHASSEEAYFSYRDHYRGVVATGFAPTAQALAPLWGAAIGAALVDGDHREKGGLDPDQIAKRDGISEAEAERWMKEFGMSNDE